MTVRAGIVTRAGAFVVDAAVVTAGLRTTVWLLGAAAHTLRRFAPPVDLGALLIAVVPLLVAIYFVAFWTLVGQTPGKFLLGVKIVAVGGGSVGFRRALLRLVGYIVSALPCYVGFLWIIGPQRRGWHDRMAGTEVVYVATRPRLVDRRPLTARPLRQLTT